MKRILIFPLLLLFAACDKENTPNPGANPPASDISIDIFSPTEGSQLREGQDTLVSLLLSDKLSLHEYTVSIDDTAGINYFYQEGHSHEAQLPLSWQWKNTSPAGSKLTLTVKASNHKLDLLERKVHFESVP